MKIKALKEVLSLKKSDVDVCLFINLSARDLKFGSMDKEIIHYALENNIYLYVNNKLHMKSYIYDRKTMHIGSANCTNSGLGISHNHNYELLSKTNKIPLDFILYCEYIKSNSMLINKEKYELIKELLDVELVNANNLNSINELDDILKNKVEEMSEIRASQLPLSPSVEYLYENIKSVNDEKVIHDKGVFNIQNIDHESLDDFKTYLCSLFFNHTFVKYVFSKFDESINFGGVRRILERECVDDPRPTRDDVNILINNFFTWLEDLDGDNYRVKKFTRTKVIFKND
jgi:hypothetical protein